MNHLLRIHQVNVTSIKVNNFIFNLMSSECEISIRSDIPITMVHGKLKSHVIIFDPPYNIRSILSEFCRFDGQCVRIKIDHSSKDISIVQPSISRLVLRTTVEAFQSHRLSLPTRRDHIPRLGHGLIPSHFDPFQRQNTHVASRRSARPSRSANTGKSCSICMEDIYEADVAVLPCAHIYHQACIRRWTMEHPNCPECRMPLT